MGGCMGGQNLKRERCRYTHNYLVVVHAQDARSVSVIIEGASFSHASSPPSSAAVTITVLSGYTFHSIVAMWSVSRDMPRRTRHPPDATLAPNLKTRHPSVYSKKFSVKVSGFRFQCDYFSCPSVPYFARTWTFYKYVMIRYDPTLNVID